MGSCYQRAVLLSNEKIYTFRVHCCQAPASSESQLFDCLQVMVNYLGSLATAPQGPRRAELQDIFKFKCECERCRAEERLTSQATDVSLTVGANAALINPNADNSRTPAETSSSSDTEAASDVSASDAAPEAGQSSANGAAQLTTLLGLVEYIYARCERLNDKLDTAIRKSDKGTVSVLNQELQALRGHFEQALRTNRVSSKARRWLQASVYDLYDLLSLCADEVRRPASCLRS